MLITHEARDLLLPCPRDKLRNSHIIIVGGRYDRGAVWGPARSCLAFSQTLRTIFQNSFVEHQLLFWSFHLACSLIHKAYSLCIRKSALSARWMHNNDANLHNNNNDTHNHNHNKNHDNDISNDSNNNNSSISNTMNDETDDGGYGAQFRAEDGCDDDVREYYDSLTPEIIGNGWFDQRLSTLHNGINLAAGRSFFANPRARDSMPSDIPVRHPLRALAWVLAQAPEGSTVRVYCYMLTDPFAIDLIIHHGANKTVQVILHPDNKNRSRLEEFFQDHGRVARRAFRDRLQVRVANTGLIRGHKYCSMHDKSIITDNHCTFGSYNLSCPARYQSWESLHIADVDPLQVHRFDRVWNSLARRTLQGVTGWTNLAPPSPASGAGGGGCSSSSRKRARSSAPTVH